MKGIRAEVSKLLYRASWHVPTGHTISVTTAQLLCASEHGHVPIKLHSQTFKSEFHIIFTVFRGRRPEAREKPSQPKELTGGCDQSPSGQEVRDVAAEASAPDSLAPCARGGFNIAEPDQLERMLEVHAFRDHAEIRTIAQSASGQKVRLQILLHSLEQKKHHPGKQCPTWEGPTFNATNQRGDGGQKSLRKQGGRSVGSLQRQPGVCLASLLL